MISAAAIVKIAPAAAPYAAELVLQMVNEDIQDNIERASKFLGQIHVESGGFARVVESMAYSPERLLKIFRGRNGGINDLAEARALLAKGQKAVANFVYGGKFGLKRLGNTQPDDGWNFRGRGLKQLTGRDNYRRFSLGWLGNESLLVAPELVAEPHGAVASAVWFWGNKGLNAIADTGDVAAVTLKVNGGDIGLPERIKFTALYRAAWSATPDFSNVTSAVHSTEDMK